MHPKPRSRLPGWLHRLLPRRPPPPTDIERARAIVAAVDAGGMPLNPATINAVARSLGLEVSRRAAVEDTIARLRAAVARHDANR